MKRMLLLFIIILLLVKFEPIKGIELEDREYYLYNIEIENLNIDKLEEYFNNDDKIRRIYIRTNPILKLNNLYYEYSSESLKNNIERLKEYYKTILQSKGCVNEISKISVNEVYITRIIVYTNLQKIRSIENKNRKVTYLKVTKNNI